MRGITELYFPSGFGDIECLVHSYRFELENMCDAIIKVSFTLIGSEKTLEKLYAEEPWKIQATENLYRHHKVSFSGIKNAAPIFALMLNRFVRVASAQLHVDGQDAGVVPDQTPDVLVLPPSYPPLAGDLPKNDFYVYYNKKSTAFYASIELEKKYDFEIRLESMGGVFEHAPVFPYGRVIIKKTEVVSVGDLELMDALFIKTKPEIKKEFPGWLQKKFDHLTDRSAEPKWPEHIKAANPFRGTDPLFNLLTDFDKPMPNMDDIPNDLLVDADKIKNYEIRNYGSLRFCMMVAIPPEKNVDVVVKTIQRPLPPRIYEQMQSLPHYEDVLVSYDVFNLDKKKLRVRIETEISGFTEKEAHTYFIPPMHSGKNQKARIHVTHCPRLKRGVLEGIINQESAVMRCKVVDENSKDVLFDQTFNIDILPHDQMIWELKDVRNSQKYRLHDFIGAWIYPKDQRGLLDAARAAAARLHPRQALGYMGSNPSDLLYIKEHVRAIYNYLQQEKMRYVSQAFTSSPLAKSQRVVLPEKVLENKSGNCIDLTVLFASLLEGLGIYSSIFITPQHAFIGWGNLRSQGGLFLETTVIDGESFEKALEIGEKKFKENFLFMGAEIPLGNSLTYESKGSVIVKLHKVRHPSLYPQED